MCFSSNKLIDPFIYRILCRLSVVLLTLPLSLSASLPAAQAEAGASSSSTTDASEPTIEDVLEKALTAYGGKAALQQVDAASIAYGRQILALDREHPLSYRNCQKGSHWRIDLDSTQANAKAENQTTIANESDRPRTTAVVRQKILAFDGVSGWQSNGQAVSDLSSEETRKLSDQEARQPSILSHWREPEYRFVLRGRTTYQQTPVFAVEVSLPGAVALPPSIWIRVIIWCSLLSMTMGEQNKVEKIISHRPADSHRRVFSVPSRGRYTLALQASAL